MKSANFHKYFLFLLYVFILNLSTSYQKHYNYDNEKSITFLANEKRCSYPLECYLDAINMVQKMKMELDEMKTDLIKKEEELLKRYEKTNSENEKLFSKFKDECESRTQRLDQKVSFFPKRVIIKTKENLCFTFVQKKDNTEGDLILKECSENDINQKWNVEPFVDMRKFNNGENNWKPINWNHVRISSRFSSFVVVADDESNPIQILSFSLNELHSWVFINYTTFDNKFKICTGYNNRKNVCIRKTKENRLGTYSVDQGLDLSEEFIIEYS